MAGQLDLLRKQGETFRLRLTWKAGGTPVDLTGWAARLQVRDYRGGLLLDLASSAGGGITLGGMTGTVVVAQPPAMPVMPAGRHAYDLKLTDPLGGTTYLVEGGVTVEGSVTA